MIQEINELRENPKSYIPYVKKFIEASLYHSRDFKKASQELLDTLATIKSVRALKPSKVLYDDAKAHGKWMRRTNKFEHSDCDCYENLAGCFWDTRDVIIDLLIDDGVLRRGHRWNLLEPAHKVVACYEVEPLLGFLGECSVVQQFN